MRWKLKVDWKLWGFGVAAGLVSGSPAVMAHLGPVEISVFKYQTT